jgi:hypothetical protein
LQAFNPDILDDEAFRRPRGKRQPSSGQYQETRNGLEHREHVLFLLVWFLIGRKQLPMALAASCPGFRRTTQSGLV